MRDSRRDLRRAVAGYLSYRYPSEDIKAAYDSLVAGESPLKHGLSNYFREIARAQRNDTERRDNHTSA